MLQLSQMQMFCPVLQTCLQTGMTLLGMLCRFWDGIYVLYTYAAQRRTSQAVQKLLSTPVVGKEKNVLRHMTFITN